MRSIQCDFDRCSRVLVSVCYGIVLYFGSFVVIPVQEDVDSFCRHHTQ